MTAAGAALVWGVPHLTYHLLNTDTLATTSDIVASIGGLAPFTVLPIAILVTAKKLPDTTAASIPDLA